MKEYAYWYYFISYFGFVWGLSICLGFFYFRGEPTILTVFFLFILPRRRMEGTAENLEVTEEGMGIRRPGLLSFLIAFPSNLYSEVKTK